MAMFKEAELTLVADDGTRLKAEVTPMKLAAMVRACGWRVSDAGDGRHVLWSFDDEKIGEEILPALPMMG